MLIVVAAEDERQTSVAIKVFGEKCNYVEKIQMQTRIKAICTVYL